MNSEYVKFEKKEKNLITRNFLTSELLLLDSLKKYKTYKKLRTEELLLKIALKTKIEHLNNELSYFEKMMPKTTLQLKDTPIEEREDYTLEEEINIIKRKIQNINSQF